ncbi:MAG: hypothetical protein UY98_C0046G0003 [Candidatus Kaiserbacteria bacterium GW2011_GWA2_58_9]|uniref:Uncharacterized protein n=2 Tax=Candidatus Kaiseribacteriota TaxID=1752734 RepID=A0A0G2BI97_9BACT|nr:MAG: hypothetical protein UY98_C0046G0003 [Candidatus Kaiserbacteria bacterium GW2011_GWA2_58_9]
MAPISHECNSCYIRAISSCASRRVFPICAGNFQFQNCHCHRRHGNIGIMAERAERDWLHRSTVQKSLADLRERGFTRAGDLVYRIGRSLTVNAETVREHWDELFAQALEGEAEGYEKEHVKRVGRGTFVSSSLASKIEEKAFVLRESFRSKSKAEMAELERMGWKPLSVIPYHIARLPSVKAASTTIETRITDFFRQALEGSDEEYRKSNVRKVGVVTYVSPALASKIEGEVIAFYARRE